MTSAYTAELGHGLGLVDETKTLLAVWQPGMSVGALQESVLQSGAMPNITARRLKNLVELCFAPRYLRSGARPARILKEVQPAWHGHEFVQLLLVYTCRANLILADFVREVVWAAYGAGRESLSNEEARAFVERANRDGKTTKPWSERTVWKVAGYLTGCCADYGLLERGHKTVRKILPYRIEPRVTGILAYDLHFTGLGDNSLIAHPDWGLFGLEPADVLNELKRLALQGLVIVQSAGGAARISWTYKSMEELVDVLAQREL